MHVNFRKISAGLCGLAVVAGTLTVSIPAANATAIVPQSVDNIVRDSNQQTIIDTFNGINAFRASKGLQPVKFSVPISAVSQQWSDTMAATDTFYHNPSYTKGVPENYRAGSEIIAARWDRSGQGLVNQWIGSPGHNAIMSDPQYNTMGVGIAYTDGTMAETGTRYGMYGTANLFRYDRIPAQTYNSPADYFAGKPPVTDPLILATPKAPTFNQYDYTLPSIAGVRYFVNGVESWPGTKTASQKTYDIRIQPAEGYYFPANTVTQYLYTYSEPAPTRVVPTEPIWDDARLTYFIPMQQGVEYVVNNVVKPSGEYSVDKSIPYVSVSARPTTGYAFYDTMPSVWNHTFPAELTVTPEPPTFNGTTGNYTVPGTTGVTYKVNGVVAATGVYTGTGTVTITAHANAGYVIATGAKTSWAATFGSPQTAINVTPTAPTFNVTAKTYTIPAKTGVNYTVNGVVKAPGFYTAAPGVVTIKAVASSAAYVITGTSSWSATYPAPVVPPAVKLGDVLAVDTNGALWNYGNRATTGRKAIVAAGWAPVKEIFVTDWNSDGIADVVAQWKAGNLTVSYGNKAGTLDTAKVIGSGWASYEVSIAKYNRADKYPSIIAKDTAGNLWQYQNLNGVTPGARIAKGTGWKALQVNVLDWDKDGNMDIVAKNSTGSLILYRTDGLGKFKPESRKIIGTGWSGFQVQSVTHYTGTGSQGFLAKDSKGNLYYYGTGNGVWLSRLSEGAGWTPMNISSS